MKRVWNIRAIVAVMAVFVVCAAAFAQEEAPAPKGWKTTMIFDLTTTQTAYNDAWVGGELGALSWVSNLNATAEKQLSPSFNFKSTLKLSFGQTLSQVINETTGEKQWEKPKKSTDLIDWENVGKLTKGWVADPYVAFRLESQFLDASFEPKKRYFNPIKLTESAGLSRKLYAVEKNEIITRLGFALRQIMMNVITDSVTLSSIDTTLTDGGIESVTDVKFVVRDNLEYTSKLTLYKAFFFSGKDNVQGTAYEDDWKAVDVNWENRVSAKITRIVTVNLYTQFLYDKEVSHTGRFKETLGIGFVFTLL